MKVSITLDLLPSLPMLCVPKCVSMCLAFSLWICLLQLTPLIYIWLHFGMVSAWGGNLEGSWSIPPHLSTHTESCLLNVSHCQKDLSSLNGSCVTLQVDATQSLWLQSSGLRMPCAYCRNAACRFSSLWSSSPCFPALQPPGRTSYPGKGTGVCTDPCRPWMPC